MMATYLQNLITRRNNIAQELAALDATKQGGKVNVTGGVGSNVDHVGYRQSLVDELKTLQDMIEGAGAADQAADIAENGPWEIRS